MSSSAAPDYGLLSAGYDPNATGSVTLPTITADVPQPQAGAGAAAGPMTDQQALIASAQRLGLSPVEWGGLMHYESGADPTRWGGTGGRHVGLIQFGPAEQKQFGVTGNESFQEQLPKAEAFLQARGYQPGSGIMQAYSTVNAGSPNRFNASDANNGGMPGTVADKVNNQFAPHYAWATKWLGGGQQMPASAGGSAPSGQFGLNGPAPSAQPAPAMTDPTAVQATAPQQVDPAAQQQASPYGDVAKALQAAAGGKQQQKQSGGGMQMAPAARPHPIGLQQARQLFDPSRFYTMLKGQR